MPIHARGFALAAAGPLLQRRSRKWQPGTGDSRDLPNPPRSSFGTVRELGESGRSVGSGRRGARRVDRRAASRASFHRSVATRFASGGHARHAETSGARSGRKRRVSAAYSRRAAHEGGWLQEAAGRRLRPRGASPRLAARPAPKARGDGGLETASFRERDGDVAHFHPGALHHVGR